MDYLHTDIHLKATSKGRESRGGEGKHRYADSSRTICRSVHAQVRVSVSVCLRRALVWLLFWKRQAGSSLSLPLYSRLLSWPPGSRQTAPPVFSLRFIRPGLTSVNTCQSILPIRGPELVGCVPLFIPIRWINALFPPGFDSGVLRLVLFHFHTKTHFLQPACEQVLLWMEV